MSHEPGPDERRVQHWLRRHGVGPDAHGDTMATNDWWNDLYTEDETKPPAEQPAGEDAPPSNASAASYY